MAGRALKPKDHLNFGPAEYPHSQPFIRRHNRENKSFFDNRLSNDQTKEFDFGYTELKLLSEEQLAEMVEKYRNHFVVTLEADGKDEDKKLGQTTMKKYELYKTDWEGRKIGFTPAKELPGAVLLNLAGAYRWRLVKIHYGKNTNFQGYKGVEADQNPFMLKVDATGKPLEVQDTATELSDYQTTDNENGLDETPKIDPTKKRRFQRMNVDNICDTMMVRLEDKFKKLDDLKKAHHLMAHGIEASFKAVQEVTDKLTEGFTDLEKMVINGANSSLLSSGSKTIKEVEITTQKGPDGHAQDTGSLTGNVPTLPFQMRRENAESKRIQFNYKPSMFEDTEEDDDIIIEEPINRMGRGMRNGVQRKQHNRQNQGTTAFAFNPAYNEEEPISPFKGVVDLIDNRNKERNEITRKRIRSSYPNSVGRLGNVPIRYNDPFKKTNARVVPPDILATIECWYCKVRGHKIQDCPKKQPDACYACGGHGHVKVNCPIYLKRKKKRGFRTDGNQTFRREESGHLVAIAHGLKDIQYTNPELSRFANKIAPIMDAFFVAADYDLDEKRNHNNAIQKRENRKYLPIYMDMARTVVITKIDKDYVGEHLDGDENVDLNKEIPIMDNDKNIETTLQWVAKDTGLNPKDLADNFRRMEWRETPDKDSENPNLSLRLELYGDWALRVMDRIRRVPQKEKNGNMLGVYAQGLTQQEINNDKTEAEKVRENNEYEEENAKRLGLDPPREKWDLVGRLGSQRAVKGLTEQEKQRREEVLADKPKRGKKRTIWFSSPAKGLSPPNKTSKPTEETVSIEEQTEMPRLEPDAVGATDAQKDKPVEMNGGETSALPVTINN